MKVCYVVEGGQKLAGSQLSLLNLINELKNYGVKPYAACHQVWELTETIESKGIETIIIDSKRFVIDEELDTLWNRMKNPAKRIYNRKSIRLACAFLKDNSIDLVHINSLLSSWIWAEAAYRCKIPYVWHIREYISDDHNRRIQDIGYLRKLASRSDSMIAISKSIKEYWDKELRCNCDVVYNGLPKEECFHITEKFSREKISCLIVGRIRESKGQFDAVKAVEEVIKRGRKNIELNIVGYRGILDYENDLVEYIKQHSLDDYIHVLDYCYNLEEYNKSADIGLICSAAEAFGRVTIEYMMGGLLAIGTNSGGTPELISDGETGYLYRFGDYESLADRIIYAMDNRQTVTEIALHAQTKALDQFSIGTTAKNIFQIYEKVLSK